MSSKDEEWTVLSMLEWATDYFEEKNIPNPRHSIEWLLAEVLGVKRLNLYLKFDRPLSKKELNRLRPLIKRRARHEPLQYIVGYTDFLEARISVDERVLIPRIETEQLVEIILDDFDQESTKEVLDIGTGSGCIAIALKMERPPWNLHASDLSEDALTLAKQNAEDNEADINFSQHDLFDTGLWEQYENLDIIVSNPPYVLPDETELLEPQVKEFEPHQALFTDSILEMYKTIINSGADSLKKGGRLYLEIHEEYAEDIIQLFNTKRWSASIRQDYDDKSRFIDAKLG